MKKSLLSHAKNPLITGSSVIFFGSLAANIFNYLFNLSMGRLLTESEFGLLTALNSVVVLVGIVSVAFANVITKFSAKYYGLSDDVGSSQILKIGLKFILIFASVLLVILTLFIPVFDNFLHNPYPFYLFLVIVSVFFSMLLALSNGFIQGRMRFYLLSGVMISQQMLRFVLSIALIFLGFALLGPFLAIVISTAAPAIFLGWYTYQKYTRKEKGSLEAQQLFKKDFVHYTYTYFLSGIGLTLLSNVDIILVRHFFSPIEAGQYAALSLMGKAIFYFTSPIGTVFFPLIAYKKEKQEKLLQTVLLAVGIVVLLSAVISFGYFFFPNLVLLVFFPKAGYKVLANYLGFYSLYILVFNVASLFNNYFLSTGKTKVYIITLIAAFSQILLIFLYHSSMSQIITVLFVNSFLLLLLYMIYYWKNERN